MRVLVLLATLALAAGLASADHLVPGIWIGTGTVTYTVHDERDPSTVTCPDETLVVLFRVTGPTTGELRFHARPDADCFLLGWSGAYTMTGTPETGYVYEYLQCFEEERVEVGPLGAGAGLHYRYASWNQYPDPSSGEPMAVPACLPDPGYSACLCPVYRIDGVIGFE